MEADEVLGQMQNDTATSFFPIWACSNQTVLVNCWPGVRVAMFTRTLARDQRRGLLIAFPNEKYSLQQ